MSYFSGQGKVFVAPLVNGVPGQFRWLGNVPDFKPTFDTSKLEHKESYTGQRLLDKVITTENKSKISAELEDWSKENVALAVRGSVSNGAGGTVTGVAPEVSPAALVAGSIWALKHPKVSALTIKDSAGSPATVDAGDYTLDADFGTVQIVDVTGYVLPFKAEYTYAAVESVAFFTEGIKEVALRFEGVNTADSNRKVLAEIYRVALDPTKELGLISDDYGKFTLEGNALVDPTKPANDLVFGQFGRLVYL
jgi:hypothetical protein